MNRAGAKRKFAEQFTLPKYVTAWFDLTALVQIDATRVAKLEISDLGCSDHFTGIVVTLANRVTGTIDIKTFRFSDHLPFDAENRADDRPDYDAGGFHAWAGGQANEFGWYIAKPKTVASITTAIEDYIGAWTGVKSGGYD